MFHVKQGLAMIVLHKEAADGTLAFAGGLAEFVLMPPPEDARDALFRIRAVMLAEGTVTAKLVLIAALAVQGTILDDEDQQRAAIAGGPARAGDNIVTLDRRLPR